MRLPDIAQRNISNSSRMGGIDHETYTRFAINRKKTITRMKDDIAKINNRMVMMRQYNANLTGAQNDGTNQGLLFDRIVGSSKEIEQQNIIKIQSDLIRITQDILNTIEKIKYVFNLILYKLQVTSFT